MEKCEKEVKKGKEIKPLVTSRVLFISVLDKILLVCLVLMFVGLSVSNFAGSMSSISYGFWARVGREILIVIGLFIYYLLLNWFYKCAVKTVLCITENEVYKEAYIPFKRLEVSIPLNKITAVSTLNLFWIFRAVIIHQYSRFPMVFFTWNNQEFKDKATELITKDKEKVENKFEDKNLIDNDKLKYVGYVMAGLVAIILLLGVIRFFCYMFSTERRLAGTYENGSSEIVLNKDGGCNIDSLVDKVTKCTWAYDKENEKIDIDYNYSGYYSYYDRSSYLTMDYNKKEKSLEYSGKEYIKK